MAGLSKIKTGGIADGCAFPSDATATTQSQGDNSTKLATTAYVDAATSGIASDSITEGNTTVEVVDTGSNGHITFDTEGVEKMRIDTAGRVGVGVTPADFGTNARAVEIHSASSVNSFLSLTNSTTGSSGVSHGFNIIASGNEARLFNREDGDMTFWNNSLEGMRLDNSGNLGIGTSDPKQMLQIGNGAASKHGRLLISADNGLHPYIQFTNGGGSQTHYPSGIWYRPGQHMELRAASSSTASNAGQLALSSNGRVGIGTTNPPYDLSLHTGGTTELEIHTTQNNGHSYLRMTGAGTTPAQIIYFGDTANTQAANITYTHTDNQLQLQSFEDIKLKPNNGNSGINIIGGGEVEIFHNNVKMFETVDTGFLSYGDILVGQVGASTERVIATANNLNLYLSNSGDDNNDGRSPANAIRTIARAWALMPKVRYPGQAVNLYFDADFTHSGSPYLVGPAPGDDIYGPYVRFLSTGAQRTITMNGNWHFRNVSGLRFEGLKFSTSSANGYGMTFRDCHSVKFYSDCDWVSTANPGWSALMTINRCTSFYCDMDWDLQSSASAGLGAVIVCDNSDVYFTGSLTKTGTKWGNIGVSVINNSYWAGTLDVNNFATGYAFGVNHYNAENGARGMLISVTVSNCTTGIQLRNNSFVRKYQVTYSGNSTNEQTLTNGGNFT